MVIKRGGCWISLILILLILHGKSIADSTHVGFHKEVKKSLEILIDALQSEQIPDPQNSEFGALRCPGCNVLHTRAAEAVFPFAVWYEISGELKYAQSAIDLGNWLIRQQQPDGSWKETPEEWTGTTTDQLLMMAGAYPILVSRLTEEEKVQWRSAIKAAADYLTQVMDHSFASINYCATTTISLLVADKVVQDVAYRTKAQILAGQVVAMMNEEGFIEGEGGRVYGSKYGADIGYEFDMSLWGLGLYAKFSGDTLVEKRVKKSLANHLPFVYPNGSIDGSWGIRSNKWTTYGSMTADGCQVLFGMYADEDPRYGTAAIKNLFYLRDMMKNGIVGYGPQYWEIYDKAPCNYPTFVRAKNLAMTLKYAPDLRVTVEPLPSEIPGWIRHFKTVDVVLIRSDKYMATVTAYRYRDIKNGPGSKYMHRPAGGSISNLWAKDLGFIQTSSQTIYRRWEPMSFPEIGEVLPLTPRIEYTDDRGYFTNLYEFDGLLQIENENTPEPAVSTSGYLKDERQYPGGVAYKWCYEFRKNMIEKTVTLRYHTRNPVIRIIEPIVFWRGMTFRQTSQREAQIIFAGRELIFRIIAGNATLSLGEDAEKYKWPFPSLRCYPFVITFVPGKDDAQQVVYQLVFED